jgi:hypothetical protein
MQLNEVSEKFILHKEKSGKEFANETFLKVSENKYMINMQQTSYIISYFLRSRR